MTSSDSDNEPSAASAILDSVVENLKHFPAAGQSHYVAVNDFGRRHKHVHDLLGGGHSADVLLWRRKHLSAGFLAGATVLWIMFEWIGYHLVSVVSFLLLCFVVILFIWSNGAAFLNRAPPPLPKLQLSDYQVRYVAENIRVFANQILARMYEIVLGTDVTRFLKLVGVLVFLVMFGNWFSLLTLAYLAVLAAHTLPVLYEKHGETFDHLGESMWREMNLQYRKFDASVLSRIPRKQPTFQRKVD